MYLQHLGVKKPSFTHAKKKKTLFTLKKSTVHSRVLQEITDGWQAGLDGCRT